MIFICRRTKEGWEAQAKENGETVAVLNMQRQGYYMAIHNNIKLWTPRAKRIYKEAFQAIITGVAAIGCRHIVVGCLIDTYDKKKEKFWRMMGFTILEAVEWKGQTIKTAIMEL